jgi:hypothetical protein
LVCHGFFPTRRSLWANGPQRKRLAANKANNGATPISASLQR